MGPQVVIWERDGRGVMGHSGHEGNLCREGAKAGH